MPQDYFFCFVHTFSIVCYDLVCTNKELAQKYSFINSMSNYRDKTVMVVNLNKMEGEIHDLKSFRAAMEKFKALLGVKNVRVSRCDYCFNTKTEYDIIYKINSFIKELYAVMIKSKNSYYTCGDDLKKRSTTVNSKSSSLIIYDKKLESHGLSPYSTRIEFRFYRGKPLREISLLLHQVRGILQNLPAMYLLLEKQKVAELCKAYEIERQENYEGRVLSLSTFVTKYSDKFYTYSILRQFYETYKKGRFSNWLSSYRKRGNVITLYKVNDVKTYLQCLLESLERYEIST